MSSTALALGLTLSFYDKLSGPLKAARGTLNSTSKALSELQDKLAKTNGLSRQAARFDAMRKKTLEYNEQISQAKKRIADLSSKIEAAEKPTKKMESALGAAKRQLEQLTEGSYRNRARMQELRQALEKGGVSTKRLTAEQARLRSEMDQLTGSIKRNNEAAARAAQIKERLNKASAVSAGVGTAAMGAGMMARGVFDNSVRAYAELENASVRLKSSMTDATGQISPLFTKIDALAQRLGAALPGTTRDFYAMFEIMLNTGVGAQSILDGVGESAAALAVVLNVSYDEAAKSVSLLKNATGVADGEMLGFLDTVQRTKSLGVDLGEMEYAFSRSGGKLKELNIQGLAAANSMSVLYASWIRSGLSGETVGTGFASVLNSLQQLAFGQSKKEADARDMLKDMNIQLRLFDGKGNFKGVENMVTELDKLRALDPANLNQVLTQIFGTGTGAQMVAALIKDGRAGFDKLTAELNAKASLTQKADMQTTTLANMWEAIGGTWGNLKAKLIGSIQGELKGSIDMIGRFQSWLDGLMDRSPMVTKAAATFLAVLAVGGPVIGGLAIGISGLLKVMVFAGPVFAVMATAARAVGTAFLFIGRALLMNPIGLILTGIAIAAYLLYTNWDRVSVAIGDAIDWLSAKWAGIRDAVSTAIGDVIDYLKGVPSRMWQAGVDIGAGLLNGIKSGAGDLWQGAKDLAGSAVDGVKDKLQIKSPSRVMMMLGQHTTEGLRLGIAGGEGDVIGQMAALAKRLAVPVAGAMALGMGTPTLASPVMAGGAGARGGDIHIQINVSVPPGADGQDIALKVADEVERATRGLTVRARSRLYDEVQ